MELANAKVANLHQQNLCLYYWSVQISREVVPWPPTILSGSEEAKTNGDAIKLIRHMKLDSLTSLIKQRMQLIQGKCI